MQFEISECLVNNVVHTDAVEIHKIFSDLLRVLRESHDSNTSVQVSCTWSQY